MPIIISPEAEAKAQQIPDFPARLERFIDDQYELEQWRRRRVKSAVAAAVVEEGLREGAALRASAADRAILFAHADAIREALT